MSFEERIEKLTERHEALAHRAELLLRTAQEDGDNIRAVAQIAEIHEHRLERLEGQG